MSNIKEDDKNLIKTDNKAFKRMIGEIQLFYNGFYKHHYNVDDILNDKLYIHKNDISKFYLKTTALMIKKRFDEIDQILKELNISYLFVYSNIDKKEMKKNADKYDIILDCLIGRFGVLYEYINLNEYIEKDKWELRFLPCICLQKHDTEDIIFLYGDLDTQKTREKIASFI